MDSKCRVKIIVAINGEISKDNREKIVDTLKENLKNYSFLEAPIEAELVG